MAVSFDVETNRMWRHITRRLGGVEAVFTPKTGAPQTLFVMLLENSVAQPSGSFQTWEMGTAIKYSLEDIPREVIVGETFTINGKVYTVKKVEENDGFVVKAVVA